MYLFLAAKEITHKGFFSHSIEPRILTFNVSALQPCCVPSDHKRLFTYVISNFSLFFLFSFRGVFNHFNLMW